MSTASGTSGLNDSSRCAQSAAAFPPALPPRRPAVGGHVAAISSFGRAADTGEEVKKGGEDAAAAAAAVLRQPLITAADYSDRKQLLSHISFLSGNLQRAELLLRHSSSSVVSDEELARFDPIVAQGHIERLESAVAQVALLRNVEQTRIRALEEELQELRSERNCLVGRVDALDGRVATLDADNKRLNNALCSAQLEVERLRTEEAALLSRLGVIEELQGDGGRYDGVNVIVATPRQGALRSNCAPALRELQMEEAVQRLALLLDMMMEPICIAFDAGVAWLTETQLHCASVQTNNSVVPLVVNNDDSEHLFLNVVEEKSPLLHGGDDTLPPTTVGARALNRESLLDELNMLRERLHIAEQQKERVRQLLYEEQKRTEMMAREHYQQLQRVHEQVVHERRHVMESLMAEVEEKMRNAFRDGRLHEKRQTEERRQKKKVSASHTSGNTAAVTRRRVNGTSAHARLKPLAWGSPCDNHSSSSTASGCE